MTRGRRRTSLVLAATLTLALLAAGCVQLPDRGAVHETNTSADTDVDEASSIDAVPPQPGAEPADIAKGFINAMSAWPIRVGVARQFLSDEAGDAWTPEAMTTFTDVFISLERGTEALVQLSDAERLDASGAWQGEVPEVQQKLTLEMTVEDGEYRITTPPDALIVPAEWFAQRFRQVSLYFFDRTGGILVPEPVFVPRGDQLATTITERLVDGPSIDLSGISRSYLPADLDPVLSVPVTDQGVALVQFGESFAAPQDADDLEKMLAQLGWTLRQVPGINALRVSIGGEDVRLPDGDREYDVDQAQQFDPAGADANPLLFGLRDGRLVYGEADALGPAEGPFGAADHHLRAVSLSLDADRAAGVSADGTSLRLAQVRGASSDQVQEIATESTNLLPPAWDFTGRLWVVDQRPGARVAFREESGKLRTLRVPGVSGKRVRAFLVSRDGTRFVAVVQGNASQGDQVRAGRILVDDQGRIDRAGPTRRIEIEGVDGGRVTDIAWNSPTSIVVVRQTSQEQDLFEVRTVAVDGAPTVAEALTTSVNGVEALAAAPDGDSTPYAVTRDALVDLETLETVPFTEGRVTSIRYVG